MKRLKVRSIEKKGMGFILELANGKLVPKYASQLDSFQRINSAKNFKATVKPTVQGFMHLNMYNCSFPTNFYAVLK